MYKIKFNNLSIGYDREIIKSDINFEINDSEYVVILGENGAGKSTFLKTFLTLIKPLKGSISYEGDIKNGDIGYLPQQATVKRDFPATNYEIVLSGCLGKKGFISFYNEFDKNNACDALKTVGMYDFKDKSFKELSGGQQQRVLLARALMATSRVLVLDEPVSGLDPEATKEMYNLIYKLNKDKRITIVMISHDVDESVKYASKIIMFNREIEVLTKEEYIKWEEKKNAENIK